jgi:hypothetical protein
MSTSPDLKFAFGNFNYICSTVSLTLCPLVGDADGIEPICYSRNVRLVDTLIFQPCKCPLLCLFFFISISLCFWFENWLLLFRFVPIDPGYSYKHTLSIFIFSCAMVCVVDVCMQQRWLCTLSPWSWRLSWSIISGPSTLLLVSVSYW